MPFGGYDDFDDCVRQNSDKEDPEAYCASIERETEGDKMTDESTEARAPRVNEKNLIERKNVTLTDVKFDGDAGTFEGYASVFNVKDLQNDIITPGAFRKTLKDNGNMFVLLDQHDIKKEIGLVRAEEDESGLYIKGEFYIDPQADPAKELRLARETYIKMMRRQEAGKPLQFSIGYRAINPRFQKGSRVLSEVALAEVSTVTFPAAPLAVTTSVKAEDGVDLKGFGPEFDEAVARGSAVAMADIAMMFMWDCLAEAFEMDGDEALAYISEESMDFAMAITDAVRMYHSSTDSESREQYEEDFEKRKEALRAILSNSSTEVEEPREHSSGAEAADDGKAELLAHLSQLKSAIRPQASTAPVSLAEDIRVKAEQFRARATKGM